MTIGEVREALRSVSDDTECTIFAEGRVYPLLAVQMDCDDKYLEFGGGWAELDTYKEFTEESKE